MISTIGAKPRGLSHSPRPTKVCTETTSAMGSPQNRAERPRTSRRREASSAALRSPSGMAGLKGEVSVFAETAFIIVQPSHAFGRFHPVPFYGVVDLRLQLPGQILFIILHRGQGLHNGCPFNDFLDV